MNGKYTKNMIAFVYEPLPLQARQKIAQISNMVIKFSLYYAYRTFKLIKVMRCFVLSALLFPYLSYVEILCV
jgi:hypothetical protein